MARTSVPGPMRPGADRPLAARGRQAPAAQAGRRIPGPHFAARFVQKEDQPGSTWHPRAAFALRQILRRMNKGPARHLCRPPAQPRNIPFPTRRQILLRQLGEKLFAQHVWVEFDNQPRNLRRPRRLGPWGPTPPPDRISKRRYGLVDRPRNQRLCPPCPRRVALSAGIIATVAEIAPGRKFKTLAPAPRAWAFRTAVSRTMEDRKSTRLNSSH